MVAKKKTPAKKKPTTRKTTSKKQSGKKPSFLTLTPTVESFYWFVLGASVIFLALWVATLNMKIQNIYNQIEKDNAQQSLLLDEHTTKKTHKH